MAISSRLALWEQKIREEDRVPPPTSPPPLFSAIPGGFIKQLVRETEKEAKAKEKVGAAPPNAKENPPGLPPVEGPPQPFVIKDPNILEVGMAGKGPGQLLQGRLNGEKPHEGEGLPEMLPEKKPPAFKRTFPRANPKGQTPVEVSSIPEPCQPTAPKPKEPAASDPQVKAPAAPEQKKPAGPKDPHPGSCPEPVRKGHVPWHKRFDGPGKENVKLRSKEDLLGRPGGRARGTGKGRELGDNKERLGETGKSTGEARRKVGEAGKASGGEKAGRAEKDPQATAGPPKEGKEMAEEAAVITPGKEGGTGEGAREEMKGMGNGPQETQEEEEGEEAKEDARTKEAAQGPQIPPGETPREEEGRPGWKGPAGVQEEGKQGSPSGSGAAAGVQEEKLQGGTPRGSQEEEEEEGNPLDKACADVWYETEKVWLVQKESFALATQLKPDFGTPELPAGKVRVRVEEDGSVLEVDEGNIQRANPPQSDRAEDLASLPSLNESSVLHTLRQRCLSQLVYTYSGSDLVALEPQACLAKIPKRAQLQASKGKREGGSPPPPPHIFSVAQKAYWRMLTQRKDQALVPLGRSGAGKTTCCQEALEYLVATAGSVGKQVTVEKIQAAFTLLRAFGSVATPQNEVSTRFSLALALDFSASGRITAAHLQTVLLERSRVARQPEGESNFHVFAQMLAGLDLDQRTLLHLHQMAEEHSFGLGSFAKAEEKRTASAAFAQLLSAMATLGITPGEQEALWRVLAGIYHLGAAGACKVGRKQFAKFEWAARAAESLGCDFEDLATAVFKHHLRRIMAQATVGPGGQLGPEEDSLEGPKLTGTECVEGMAAGLYEELFATVVSLINRSFTSSHLSVASILVLDTPGFHNPRHQRKERAATFEEFCHNYAHERLQGLFYERTFLEALERYREENVDVAFDLPDLSPADLLPIVDRNASKPHSSQGGDPQAEEEPKGLFWILDEEALVQGCGDSGALRRLCSYFAKGGVCGEDHARLRPCEQALHFELSHQLGQDPVRYDAAGWVAKAKWNLSAQNAPQVLRGSSVDPLKKLFLARSKTPLSVRPVAGLEGATSQQSLQRIGCVRRTFSSAFAAVKRRSVCAQIKLQMDALLNLVKRAQIHFVHCLVPRAEAVRGEEGSQAEAAGGPGSWDVPSLRAQLSGAQVLDALRLYRIGYADRMGLTQFRRRFQVLAPPVMKKYTSAYETADEAKALEELFQALSLEKKTFAMGRTQIFLKAGVLASLEKQRERLVAQSLVSLQAACKGFLSRQRYRKLKIQFLAARCIQRNLGVFQSVKTWAWWRLLCAIRPLLTISVAEGQLQAKEEEIVTLRKKLENSELTRQELCQSTELLETKVLDLTMELSDEHVKGDVACQALEGERAERLRGSREIRELQSKHDQLQKKLESVERQLEETQQQLELQEFGATSPRKDGEWQMRLECAQTEIGFLRKRIAQLEERLESEEKSKKELEEKLREAQKGYEGARKSLQQLRRKAKQVTCDLEDTRVLAESQQSRNHELEKRQKKFDLQLAQALGESAFERSLREKLAQENSSLQFQVEKLQRASEQKDSEHASLVQRAELLSARLQELSSSGSPDARREATLRNNLWDLEATVADQQKALGAQTGTLEQMEQLHLRLELEIERTKQLHQKELEDKEEELEDVRQSCQKRLRQLEGQWEGSCEEKQALQREKKDLEGLVALLCEQIGHRDFDVEKRLRRDLKRTRALLADMQLLLEEASAAGSGPSGAKEALEKLQGQLDESQVQQAESQKSQKMLALEVDNLRTELEGISRNKTLVDEELYLLQHEKADLLRRVDEDQEDLNELMAKHKALIAQSAMDIAQIRELQAQLEEMKKQKQSLQEKLKASQAQVAYLEQTQVERSIVSRQEALICDLENKVAFQSVQIKRLEALVLRLRDSVLKMGEDLGKAREGESREKENGHYYQMRMEEMKAEVKELAEREQEAHRRQVDLEKQVEELSAVRQTLQADLETSIRRIADLQVALEEVQSSDESDTESLQTARESFSSRLETESQLSLPSTVSLNLAPEGSIASCPGPPSGWTSPSGPSPVRSPSRLSLNSQSTSTILRMRKDPEVAVTPPPESPLGAKRKEPGWHPGEPELGPSFVARRRPFGTLEDAGVVAPPAMMPRLSPPSVAGGKLPSPVSPSTGRRISPAAEEKLLRSSSALSEYVEELRRNRLKETEPGKLPGWEEEASALPIYQTAGASSLRRCRALKEGQDLALPTEDLGGSAGLVRTSSLKSVSSDNAGRPLPSPTLKRMPQFGSYDSLIRNTSDSMVGSLASGMGKTSGPPPPPPPQPKQWRSYLETSLGEASIEEAPGGLERREPLVFESKRFGEADPGSDPLSWKIPAMCYERKVTTSPEVDYFTPAIRKAQSPSSLARGSREKPMSVRFEDEVPPKRTFLSEIKTVLSPPPPPSKEGDDPAGLSDSSDSSSGSQVSFKSNDSIKRRPKTLWPRGGRGAGRWAGGEGAHDTHRSEAEGKEDDDVNSVMMRYLGKD